MSRSRRRRQLYWVKQRAKRIFWWAADAKWVAKLANNLASCSRYCCGNRRKYEGPSRKEQIKDELLP